VTQEAPPTGYDIPQTTHTKLGIGSFSVEAETSVTPRGLLAIGGLVSMILVSVAPILLSAAVIKRAKRALPPPKSEG